MHIPTVTMERKRQFISFLFFILVGAEVATSVDVSPEEKNPGYWFDKGQTALKNSLRVVPNTGIAKNVILFVGDGMGISTVMAARVYKGQKEGRTGEDCELSFEKFPYSAFSKTYSVSNQVPDSSTTATALLTGVKSNSATVGVSATTTLSDCDSVFGNELTSIGDWAQQAGKDTGVVSTARITHATPASLYGNSAHRDWENDAKLPDNAKRCKDLAKQLIEDTPGKNIKVILGGGRGQFKPESYTDAAANRVGHRRDGKDLIEDWIKEKKDRNVRARYVSTAEELASVDRGSVDYLLGLFNDDHLEYMVDKPADSKEPTIAEMTKAAINMLQKNDKGFFLLVEGGRIDHGHHNTSAIHALSEAAAMSDAVETAYNMTSNDDTLIIVTADHSHVFTVAGYPKRGNPILGIAGISDKDNLPYTTLMYANGPMYHEAGPTRRDLTSVNTQSREFHQDVLVPLEYETHGGEDVPIYATGPMAHLFRGVVEENYVAHVMAYASCVGRNKDHCQK